MHARIATVSLTVVLAALGGAPARADPAVVTTKDFPAGEPLAIAVHEGRDKVYVTDDDAQAVHILDGDTLEVLETLSVGGSAFEIAVNETNDRVYVASAKNPGTPSLTSGTGLISVIDAQTDEVVKTINPGAHTGLSWFALAADETNDRVYVSFRDGVGVIDAATDTYTSLSGEATYATRGVVNTVTHKAYFEMYGANAVRVIDGAASPTPTVSTLSLAFTGGSGPLDLTVGEPGNKLYLTMIQVPGQGQIGILILDLDTNAYKFVGADDLEPLAFNQATNRLFSGVQVGQRGAIVDGTTDELAYVELGGAGIGDTDVRSSSDNAYHVNPSHTLVINGATRCTIALPTGSDRKGGLFSMSVAVNQATGRVYVLNDNEAGRITAIADGTVPCDETPPETTIDFGPAGEVRGSVFAFTFSSSEPNSTFECRMDAAAFASCTSPYVSETLAPGDHVFQVTATDKAGNVDPTPATRSFTIGSGSSTSQPPPQTPFPPPQTPFPPPPPFPAVADEQAPVVALGGSLLQRWRRFRGAIVIVECLTEACDATARGVVAVAGRTRALRAAGARIAEGERARLELAATAAARRLVTRAFRARRKVVARVTVTVRDDAGNQARARRTIHLRR